MSDKTDWAKVYNHYKSREGTIITARYIVEGLIMREENLNPQQAKDFLQEIIINDVDRKIAEQNETFSKIRRCAG